MGYSRITILIVPSANGSLRKFKIAYRYIYCGLISLAILSAIGVGTIVHTIKLYRQNRAFEEIRLENAELRASLKKSEIVTQKLTRKISALTRLSARLKAISGLASFHAKKPQISTTTQLGMGGVTLGSVPNAGLLLALERRAETLEQNLKVLQSYIQSEKPFSTPSIYPAEGFISSGFGSRPNPFTSLPDFHEGIDISNEFGTPVVATGQGKVIHAGTLGSFGLTIEIEHENGIQTLFGHLAKIYVKVGEEVTPGEKIGLMGNTGMSTGPHLHYEVRIKEQPVNPRPYLTRRIG
jgi:murein DD-endopeptidase MepM/ murein hydrolase activator NlpD